MKKLFFGFVLIILFAVSFINIKGETYNTVYDSTGTSTFTPTSIQNDEVYGVNHQIVKGTAVTKGSNYGQLLNVFSMKTDGITSKLVTWAVQKNNTSFSRKNIIDAAVNYEKNNPGWIVVGGINADQYFFKFGTQLGIDGSAIMQPSPYYPMVSNGDKIFTVTATGNSTNVVGFTNDGSTNSFVHSAGAGGYVLSVIDENNEISSTFVVDGINRNATGSETTLWSYHFGSNYEGAVVNQDVSTTNKLYVVENAELAYMNMYQNGTEGYYPNYNTNSMFEKGYISNDSSTSYSLGKGQFAIETNNASVIAALANGVHIKVEHYFANDEMNAVGEAIGYHSCHRLNGVDNASNATYNTQHYSRALVGRKADGTYILISADYVTAVGSFGLNWTECNAVAEYFGVQDMYQMDGGGSVTAMIRQSDGSFKVTNYPKDSGNPLSPRENLSYLFFVIRDPGVQCLDEDITYHSVKLTKKEIKGSAIVSNIKVTLNNKTYDFDSNELEIDGLTEKTDYKISIEYDVEVGGVKKHSSFDKLFTTKAYKFPNNLFSIQTINKNSVDFVVNDNEYSEHLSNVVLYVGDNSYNVGIKKAFTADNLFESETYVYYFSYDIYDPISKTTYHNQTSEKELVTKAYNAPIIETFDAIKKEDNTISISYKYTDADKVASSVYILLNGEKAQTLERKIGTVKLEGLDFKNNDYLVKLVIEYGTNEKKYSVEIKFEKEPEETKPDNPPVDDSETGKTDPVNPPVTPEPAKEDSTPSEKKKCGKKSIELIATIISGLTLFAFVLRKRR